MRSESGQATVEWVALVLFLALAMGALLALAPRVDGRSLGGLMAQRITCAAKGGCAGRESGRPPRGRRDKRALIAPVAPAPLPVPRKAPQRRGQPGRARGLLKRVGRKVFTLNGLVCYLGKSTAKGDTNRFNDDVGDAINCLNPLRGLTGDVGGTDGR